MPTTRMSPSKSLAELTLQWDQLAAERDRQIASGIDLSFAHVVAPTALRLLRDADLSQLLDVGCGTGHFSALASMHAASIVGIEPSQSSLEIAIRVCANKPNVRFLSASLEDVASSRDPPLGTAAIALMVMMTAPDIHLFARSLRSLLLEGAVFVAVIPHPCFWPTYWGYADAPWFDYSKQTFIEAPFAISNQKTSVYTTHIHRPLTQYLTTFAELGFKLDALEEPMPDSTIQALYPAPWRFPRFIAFRWIKA